MRKLFEKGDILLSEGIFFEGSKCVIEVISHEEYKDIVARVLESNIPERPVDYIGYTFSPDCFVLVLGPFEELLRALDQLEHGNS